jgi:hypothetical protein
MHLKCFHFKVITDHKPLTYLVQLKEPRGKIASVAGALGNFDFQIQNRPRRFMVVADALSRSAAGAITLEGLRTESALIQLSNEDIRTVHRWVETKVNPKDIKHHVSHSSGWYSRESS